MKARPGIAAATAALLAAGLSVMALDAPAYTLERVPGSPPLYWNKPQVDYVVNAAGYPFVPEATVIAAVQRAMAVWGRVPCGGPDLRYAGASSLGSAKLDGANLVVMRYQDWPPDYDNVIALSTVFADQKSGQIVEVDMEINGKQYVFSTPGTARYRVHDIENTVVHETGHLLGLDHAPAPEATMYSSAPVAEYAKRSLDLDDILGYCVLYVHAQPGAEEAGGCNAGFSSSYSLGLILIAALLALLRKLAKRAPTS